VNRVLVLVEVADEVLDAAVVLELGAVLVRALVDDRDLEAASPPSWTSDSMVSAASIHAVGR